MGCINEQHNFDLKEQMSVPQNENNNFTTYFSSLVEQSLSSKSEPIKNTTQDNTFSEVMSLESNNKKEDCPTLELNVSLMDNPGEIDSIIITPNSIGNANENRLIKPEGIFTFGNSDGENDYVIDHDNIGERQFSIQYKNNKYYINDSQSGSGVFMKIDESKAIKRKLIITFATCFICLEIDSNKSLNVTYHQGEEVFKNTLNTSVQKIFKIGRGNECDIVVNNNSISRIQCSILYEKERWVVYDGIPGKTSTNGIW